MALENGPSYQNASGPFNNGPLELMDLVIDLGDGPGIWTWDMDPGDGPERWT